MTNEKTEHNELKRIIEMVWRRKLIILLSVVVIFSMVSVWALSQPNLYLSTSSIFIESQEAPDGYVRTTVTAGIEGRMRTITQQLNSRTKLTKVINEFDLYPDAKARGVPVETLVVKMRKALIIETPVRREQNFFQVSYMHPDPMKAMRAVSRLVSLFIEESLDLREQQAEGTTSFIEEELASLKMVLEEQETAIQNYRRKYMGELPGQLEANLRMLDNLQLQLTDHLESRRDVDNRIVMLEQELLGLDDGNNIAAYPVQEDSVYVQLLLQRDQLNQDIAAMESKFTDRHPDLIRARKTLASVIERIQSTIDEPAQVQPAAGAGSRLGQRLTEEQNILKRQLTDYELRRRSLKQEGVELRERLEIYQKRVEATPKREQQLLRLTRDYENTKNNYDELHNKKLEAQLSENLEKRQKGDKFRILDVANLPEKPYLPNRPKIITMGFAGGLGIGVALALLLETLFPAFHSLDDMKPHLTLPIVLGIPLLLSPEEKKLERVKWARRILAGAAVFAGVLLLMKGILT